jgi:beta-fructofuranosidase
MRRFFKPEHARVGDTIPFFWDGVYHVFYLKRYADDTHDRIEADWWHLTSTDLVTFVEVGVAVPRGGVKDPDHSAATGSVVRVGDEFHLYYTGFSAWQLANGGRHQTILRARSTDLTTWTKDPDFSLVADEARYDRHEWRDPFVFWDEDSRRFRMLIAGQKNAGPALRRGATVEASSPDGEDWVIGDPLWAPGLFSMHECPDLFRMGEWWYLVYSTLTDRTVTRYRMARSLDGPWLAPADDELDGLGLYAAKTIGDGERRHLVGWCPNAAAGKDGAPWLWGGNLIVHELGQAADGHLLVRASATVRDELARLAVPAGFPQTRAESAYGYATSRLCAMPHIGYADLKLTPAPGTKVFGIELRTDDERRHGYAVSFEPALHRLRVDRLDRFGAEAPFDVRPFELVGEAVSLTIEFDGEVAVVYVDGRQAVTLRGYDLSGDQVAVFVEEGAVETGPGAVFCLQARPEEDR